MQVLAKRHFVRRRQTGKFGIDVSQRVLGCHSNRDRLPEGFARGAPTWLEPRACNLLKRTASGSFALASFRFFVRRLILISCFWRRPTSKVGTRIRA